MGERSKAPCHLRPSPWARCKAAPWRPRQTLCLSNRRGDLGEDGCVCSTAVRAAPGPTVTAPRPPRRAHDETAKREYAPHVLRGARLRQVRERILNLSTPSAHKGTKEKAINRKERGHLNWGFPPSHCTGGKTRTELPETGLPWGQTLRKRKDCGTSTAGKLSTVKHGERTQKAERSRPSCGATGVPEETGTGT